MTLAKDSIPKGGHGVLPSSFTATAHPAITLEPWQYRLTATPHPGAQPLGVFWLSIGPGLPMTLVFDSKGAPAGALLGFPIDLQTATCVADEWIAPKGADLSSEKGIYQTLRALGGQYVWICTTGGRPRIFPDAITQVTCVWDPASQSAGATTLAILDAKAYTARFDKARFKRLNVIGEGWFPAGLTAHDGVLRLLPNHYLDLETWSAHRFTPLPERDTTPAPSEIMDGIIGAIRTQVSALMGGAKKPIVALTAGRDSRTILACLRDWASQLQFVTVTGQDRHQVDTVVTHKMATDLGLKHTMLPRQTADQAGQDLFLRRSGHCFGDSNMKYFPSVTPLAADHIFVGGVGGEVARAFYWRTGDANDLEVTPALLLARMGLPHDAKTESFVADWLNGLSDVTDAKRILDLAYLEMRQGPWATAQFCADPTLVRFAPMITYDTIYLMLALPDDWKRDGRLNSAIIEHVWPALNTYPYNTLGRFKDFWVRLQRLRDDPSLLLKKLRQHWA